MLTYDRITPKLIKVIRDGAFSGYLEKGYRKASGFKPGFTYWYGTISGQKIIATTLTAAKAKIAALV